MKKTLIAGALYLFPAMTFAATTVNTTNLQNAIKGLISVVNLLIPFFVAIAVVVFIYGLIKYVLSAGDAAARVEARGYIIYGIVGIAVMLSIFGLVHLLQGTLGISADPLQSNDLPKVPTTN